MQNTPQKTYVQFDNIINMRTYARQNHLLLYAYKNLVYDLTAFSSEHPGGYSEIAKYQNTNIEKILYNPQIHRHSPKILFVLAKYQCGVLGEGQKTTLVKSKSSQSIIEQTRKNLFCAANYDYYPIPEDCCIETVPSIKTHRRLFNSLEQVILQK